MPFKKNIIENCQFTDADTQVATLQMVAGKQAEVGILESPVIKCQQNLLPGIDSLYILTSLGPLPPYRIMAKKTLSGTYMKFRQRLDKKKSRIIFSCFDFLVQLI